MQNPWTPRSPNSRIDRSPVLGRIYLVTLLTRDREPLFMDLLTGRRLARELALADADTLAYVAMPDHLHWLIRLRDVSLPVLVRRLKACSAGMLWQHGYKDHAMRSEEDVRETARYVITNPLRTGLVGNVLDYPLWDVDWMWMRPDISLHEPVHPQCSDEHESPANPPPRELSALTSA